VQGWIHAKTQIPSFVVTLGGLGVFSGVALKISSGSTIPIVKGTGVLDWLAKYTFQIPNTFLLVLACLLVLVPVLRWTPLGRAIYGVGAAEPAARLSGTRATRVRVIVFALSGMLATLAAACLASQTGSGAPTLGGGLLLPALASVVVGGTAISGGVGGLGRAVIGGLIISAVASGTVISGANPALQEVLFGIAIIVAVALTTDRRKIGVIK